MLGSHQKFMHKADENLSFDFTALILSDLHCQFRYAAPIYVNVEYVQGSHDQKTIVEKVLKITMIHFWSKEWVTGYFVF